MCTLWVINYSTQVFLPMTIRTEYCVGLIFAYCVVPYYPVVMYATAMGLYGSAQISVIKVYGPRLLALRGFEGVQFLEKNVTQH